MSDAVPFDAKRFNSTFRQVLDEAARIVVGQEHVEEQLLLAIFGGGHVLLTGMPGLGRTLLVKSLAQIMGLDYRRIQFTPDLLPTDIVGTEVLEHKAGDSERRFHFFKGPVFANLVLADEINRSPPRTQSALLELMQERQVTTGGQTRFLPKPFILIATQNSLDNEGIWSLGEAQADRFMMCIEQKYPGEDAEARMLAQTTGAEKLLPRQVTDAETVLVMQAFARDVPVVPSVKAFALALARASRPGKVNSAKVNADVRLGASPRAAQAMLAAGKVLALARGRQHVTRQDIVEVARPVLNHRVLMNARAQAQGRDSSAIVEAVLAEVERRAVPSVSTWTRALLKQRDEAGANS
ncbi:MAG TPA: MoxR family ATPase [Planctomycetota bacterium]|nr:MoxR family ATPase [Planctomycetota bacterium]